MSEKKNAISSTGFRLTNLKLIILPLISLIFVILCGYYVVWPWWVDINNKKDMIEQFQSQVTVMAKKLETLNSYNLTELEDYLLELELAIPRQSIPTNVLATIENQLVKNNIYLKNVEFGGSVDQKIEGSESEEGLLENESIEKEETGAIKIPEIFKVTEYSNSGDMKIQLTVLGEYYQLAEFINQLSRSKPLVEIVSFNLGLNLAQNQNPEADLPETSHTISLNISAPYIALKGTINSESTPISAVSAEEYDIISLISKFDSLYDKYANQERIKYESGKDNPF